MSHFQHLICYLYSIANKIYVYEICKLLNSFFIHNLYSVPTFWESGLYIIYNIFVETDVLFLQIEFKTELNKQMSFLFNLIHPC